MSINITNINTEILHSSIHKASYDTESFALEKLPNGQNQLLFVKKNSEMFVFTAEAKLTVDIAFTLYSSCLMWFCNFWISDVVGSGPFCWIGPGKILNNIMAGLKIEPHMLNLSNSSYSCICCPVQQYPSWSSTQLALWMSLFLSLLNSHQSEVIINKAKQAFNRIIHM